MVCYRNATWFLWDANSQENTREKGTKFKGATIRNKFTQAVNIIISNTINTHKVPHPSNYLE